MTQCPFCGKKLRHYSYDGYYDPPEYGEECNNKRCGKYAINYFYYDGFTYVCGNWSGNSEREFKLRMRYHRKYGFK